jgi:hypothetical protein
MQVVEVVEFIIRELQLLAGVQVEEEQEIREEEVTTLLQAVPILEVAEVLQDGERFIRKRYQLGADKL